MKAAAETAAKATYRPLIQGADTAATAAGNALERTQQKLEALRSTMANPNRQFASPVQAIASKENMATITERQVQTLEQYATKREQQQKRDAAEVRAFAIAARQTYDTHQQYAQAAAVRDAAGAAAGAREQAQLERTLHFRAANANFQRESVKLFTNQTAAMARENTQILGATAAWAKVNASIREYNAARAAGTALAATGERQLSMW